MKTCVPNYYSKFACKAGECSRSCCIGWEIDIDDEALALYERVSGAFGERLKNSIAKEDGCAHFCLDEDERCPFLDENNLCDIYINLGEASLCRICTDHPRWRNYIADRCEVGLGLACEAAAELILSQTEPADWIMLEETSDEAIEYSDWETELLTLREKIIAGIRNREKTMSERIALLLEMCGGESVWFGRSPEEWRRIFGELERLDPKWDVMLEDLNEKNAESAVKSCGNASVMWENLLMYFVYRHVTNAEDEWELAARLSFAVLSCAVVFTIAESSGINEAAVMYSSEIEYCEENTEALFDMLYE